MVCLYSAYYFGDKNAVTAKRVNSTGASTAGGVLSSFDRAHCEPFTSDFKSHVGIFCFLANFRAAFLVP